MSQCKRCNGVGIFPIYAPFRWAFMEVTCPCALKNPAAFSRGDLIRSAFSCKVYAVIESDNRGMAILKDTETKYVETWNAYNNPHFVLQPPQLTLFTP